MKEDKDNKDPYSFSMRLASRKYILTLLIFIAGTLLCGLPPVLSVFVYGSKIPLVVLSGTEWVTVITMICGFYFGANVAQKKLLDKSIKENNNSDNNNEDTNAEKKNIEKTEE